MSKHENLKILAFVGMAGSGKSVAVEYFTEKGFPKVYFGGVIVKAVEEAGLEVNEQNERAIREKLREQEGKDVVVKRIIKQIHDLADAGQKRIIADGLYSWTEYKSLKNEFPGEITVVAIVAPRSERHRRLENRSVRPLSQSESSERDWAEIENMEKGGPIAIADYYAINNSSIENLYQQLDNITEDIDFKLL